MENRDKPIPGKKLKSVQEIIELSKNSRTILFASIKNLPASQFQEISKKLRGKAVVKVPKKSIMIRSLDSSKEEGFVKLKELLKEDIAILFSDLDTYDLASELVDIRSPAKAKKGQIAPDDIMVEEGPTELLPGPAVSELGAVGIQIMIDKGKIHIKNSKVISKKGDVITGPVANVLSKLDIKPFTVGFEPLVAYDAKDKKIYLNISIDKEGTLNELKISFRKALSFTVEVGYYCEDTIKLIIQKVGREELAIVSLSLKENITEEKVEEYNTPETKEESGEEN